MNVFSTIVILVMMSFEIIAYVLILKKIFSYTSELIKFWICGVLYFITSMSVMIFINLTFEETILLQLITKGIIYILNFIYIKITYKVGFFKTVLSILLISIYMTILEVITSYLVFNPINNFALSGIIIIISSIGLLCLSLKFLDFSKIFGYITLNRTTFISVFIYALMATYFIQWKWLDLEKIIYSNFIFIISTLVVIFIVINDYKTQYKENIEYATYTEAHVVFKDKISCTQHEYKNQLHIIRGILVNLCIPETKEAVEYIDEFLNDFTTQAFPLYHIHDQIINGFLSAMIAKGHKQGIKFDIKIIDPNIRSAANKSELTNVLGILFDNAIHAVIENKSQETPIKITFDHIANKTYFKIQNQHTPLGKNEIDKIFAKGYTTKSNQDGHGIGLYHAKKIVHKYNGSLNVNNEDVYGINYVTFELFM